MYLQACGTALAGENQRSFFFGAFQSRAGANQWASLID